MKSEMKLLTIKEVKEITKYKTSKCYRIIQELNEELKERGHKVFNGKIPEYYFKERYFPYEKEAL